MSAYICNPEHIGVLAAYAALNKCELHQWEYRGRLVETAQRVAKELTRENIRSVAHRYPNAGDDLPGPNLKPTDIEEAAAIYAAYFVANPQRLTPVQVLSLCAGYVYQACECDDWRTTDAELQVERIQNAAIRSLPGYADADWSFDRQIPEIEALYQEN